MLCSVSGRMVRSRLRVRNLMLRNSRKYIQRQFSLSMLLSEKIPLDEHISRVSRRPDIRKPSQIYNQLAQDKIINDDSFQVCLEVAFH